MSYCNTILNQITSLFRIHEFEKLTKGHQVGQKFCSLGFRGAMEQLCKTKVWIVPEHFDLDHDQISRSKWSTLALPKIPEKSRKMTQNGAVSIIGVSRLFLQITSECVSGVVVDTN